MVVPRDLDIRTANPFNAFALYSRLSRSSDHFLQHRPIYLRSTQAIAIFQPLALLCYQIRLAPSSLLYDFILQLRRFREGVHDTAAGGGGREEQSAGAAGQGRPAGREPHEDQKVSLMEACH